MLRSGPPGAGGAGKGPPAMSAVNPDQASRRQSFLSFQPPAITEEEIEAVSETLRSGWLTTGPRTAELEARMREYLEAKKEKMGHLLDKV